ncbi:MAG: helix-turn-helix transcriptional regulator [Verrucomicrobiota bacterium]|nr:helix-turn-helix transcriptional regulator [Verrucomicrobiota bacterium]MDQ6939036.1 helix-turn-helix transcriptional regulator [Verrucomicrobiota bacterium]
MVKHASKRDGKAERARESSAVARPVFAIPYPPGISGVVAEEARGIPHFTDREQEVGGWMAEGKTDAEVADILGIGLETVKTHVKSLLDKIDVENRNAFVAWV